MWLQPDHNTLADQIPHPWEVHRLMTLDPLQDYMFFASDTKKTAQDLLKNPHLIWMQKIPVCGTLLG